MTAIRKIKVLFLLVLASLFLNACFFPSQNTASSTAIELRLYETNVPIDIPDGGTANFNVLLENYASSSIATSFLVTGIDPAILSFPATENKTTLQGRSDPTVSVADSTVVAFKSNTYEAKTEKDLTETLEIQACYPIRTRLSLPICINADGRSTGTCQLSNNAQLPAVQDGAVKIAGLTTHSSDQTATVLVQISILLAQDQSKDVFSSKEENLCTTSAVADTYNKHIVTIPQVLLGTVDEKTLNCRLLDSTNNEYNLQQHSQLACSLSVPKGDDYRQELHLDLEYNVRDSITIPIRLRGSIGS